MAKINYFHVEQFAYCHKKLKSVKEGEWRLLHNSMIVYGSANGHANRHNHDDLPILLAGRGGGALNPGCHVKLGKETPMTNLYLSMLERMDVPAQRVGDSTGKLEDI